MDQDTTEHTQPYSYHSVAVVEPDENAGPVEPAQATIDELILEEDTEPNKTEKSNGTIEPTAANVDADAKIQTMTPKEAYDLRDPDASRVVHIYRADQGPELHKTHVHFDNCNTDHSQVW